MTSSPVTERGPALDLALDLMLARVGEDVMDGEVVEDGENEGDGLRNEQRQPYWMVEDPGEDERYQHAAQASQMEA